MQYINLLSGAESRLNGDEPNKLTKTIQYIIPSKYKIGQIRGCGTYGCVFNYNSNVIKIVPTRERDIKSIELITNELKLTKIASDLDISPKLLDYFSCIGKLVYLNEGNEQVTIDVRYFFIVMEEFDMTLYEYRVRYFLTRFGPNINKIESQVLDLITRLYKKGITHNDIHYENIMVKLDEEENIVKIRLIDFGISKRIHDIEELNYKYNEQEEVISYYFEGDKQAYKIMIDTINKIHIPIINTKIKYIIFDLLDPLGLIHTYEEIQVPVF